MTSERTLTTTEVVSAATSELKRGGYQQIELAKVEDWRFSNSRFFEDRFGIVAVVVFESWNDLSEEWTEVQASFVELISKYIGSSEPKAWDGYLVLLTPGIRGSEGQREWMTIRYNTSRVRKLVASGEDLRNLGNVRDILLPLLPIQARGFTLDAVEPVLDLVPRILKTNGDIEPHASEVVVSAFRAQKNMVQSLHEHRKETP